ncbi:MAG TPA: alcohol dehydrogenase catalytic domain-containing protein [Candidatus Limenecus avicola]|uniref:Alcohol dehydrogenase catalytic domain-containing protein n=1 Tax=Candidatus Limenecus avicola TaxID=2840847 RepID=A0A9D1N0J6_9CLOT|nr:alcohol dehydrogenase catalytic domain-containing protein [Clostridium sp.]HIU92835.1 alcohol dehydrogenase catalytic domain-containing protein [Candidatus Limenecus avicola]
MKAVVFDNGLKLDNNYPMPVPQKGEALIKVNTIGICNTDYEITLGYMGYKGILGHEFTGVVEKAENKDLIGKRVVGEINCGCGQCDWCAQGLERHCFNRSTLGIWQREGCFAEYVCLPEKNLLVIPDNVTDEEAVFVEPLAAALEILEQVHIPPYKRVIVLGDGKLGLIIALALNAAGLDITLVGKHEEKLNIAKAQGVKTELLNNLKIEKAYDFVVEATGSITGFETSLALTKPRGTLILKSTIAASKEFNLAPIVIDEITVLGSRCGQFAPALRMLEQKRIDVKPLISDIYAIDDSIEAFERNKEKSSVKVLVKVK